MNLDSIIANLQTRIATIVYMKTVYGRALIMKEQWGDATQVVTVPKVRTQNNDYKIALPDDTTEPMVFFQAVSREQYGTFDRFAIGDITRQVALTFWGKLGDNNTPASLEQIKFDIIAQVQKCPQVKSIDGWVDDRYQDVFPDFAGYLRTSVAEENSQWLMAPYSGGRLTFTVAYTQPIC